MKKLENEDFKTNRQIYKQTYRQLFGFIKRIRFRVVLNIFLTLTLLFGLLAGASGCVRTPSDDSSDERLNVVASFYPMYDFSQKIGGDKIIISNLVPNGAEPHSWEPDAADLISLEKADVFVYNGAGMEHWVDSVLSALQNKDLVVVETAANLDLIAAHDHEHESEVSEEEDASQDNEIELDPHVWLDPMLAKQQMNIIKAAFSEADPKNAEFYASNYEKVAGQLDLLDREFHDSLTSVSERDIIVAHAAYGYLAAAYDLNQIAISGLSPEQEPDPARMAEIIDLAKQNSIKVIFFEELVSPKVAEIIAEATGAETAVLSPLGGLTDQQLADGEDYFSIMRQNLDVLKSALD